MRVLSLFDGMSCGQQALERAGIPVTEYLASEIDPYAIQITQKNYPDTVQLGDIEAIDILGLPEIDLALCGSPCQGFSGAGAKKGFDDPRSRLWWRACTIIHALKERNPNLRYLVENVRMRQDWEDTITESLGGPPPVRIDSALVSAQSRKRVYWTNFPVDQPEDKRIYLADILEDGLVDREKAYCVDACYAKGGNLKSYFDKGRRQLIFGNADHPVQLGNVKEIGYSMSGRVYSPTGKSPTLTTITGGQQHKKVARSLTHYRILTPTECERLQTVEDGYTEGVSATQRYRMLGNGWTVDTIAHILGGIDG
jgi:site-specific DNA-cytosine methylase